MSGVASNRWFGFSRKTVLIAVVAIVAVNLLCAVLSVTSTIPCHWSRISHAGTVTVIKVYWDGQTEINEYPATGWTLLADCAIWSALAAATAACVYIAVRLVKVHGPVRIPLSRLSAWIFATAILFASAFALAAFLER